jgi:hypothetical protein
MWQPFWIRFEFQITQPADAERSKQWPKQSQGSDEQRTMEKRFEIDLTERHEDVMTGEALRGPEQERREQCSNQQCSCKVNEQPGGVFQGG